MKAKAAMQKISKKETSMKEMTGEISSAGENENGSETQCWLRRQ